MTFIFATHNQHKLKEVQSLLPEKINVLSLDDIQFNQEIEETEPTIEGNALIKAKAVSLTSGYPCFSDDSGLLVEALNREPGVHSARYAGPQKNDEDNIQKLLTNLKDTTNRIAYFKTVMALVFNEKTYLFEGIVNGSITEKKRGSNGFGYDPVFLPDGFNQTFAEMDAATKNTISHRGIALKKLINFLTTSNYL
ncbi:MAG: non-canonical purine pyrophosphatase [Bacteroidota bacterium]|jgi:XTP/dITP diphosphohydrolase|nr:non-canonical purine pyrophosphatase [Bacteroidota bacterium]